MDQNISEGARLLIASGSLKSGATLLGCSARAISAYRVGRRPSGAMQQKMWDLLHIPPAAWSQRAGTPAISRAAKALTNGPSPADAPEVADTAPGQPGANATDENAVQRLRAQCSRLRASREAGNLTPRALVELEQLELRCSTQLARLTTHSLSEAQIMASRQWQELAGRIVDALSARDVLGFNIFWSACDPESAEPAEALEAIRCAHPAELAACELANETLCQALALALRNRQRELESPQKAVA